MGKLDPIVSEFETEEDAAAYDVWFRAQVQEALDSDEPSIPHEQVMAEMRELIASSASSTPASATRNRLPADGSGVYPAGMGKLDPIVSEFETEEDAAAYDVWFRAQVQAALDSNEPRIPHEQVVARIEAILQKYRDSATDLGA